MKNDFDIRLAGSKVYSHLVEDPQTRDDDRLLLSQIWDKESKASTKEEFLSELREGKITHFESIRRSRQRIQQRNDRLRGDKWESRHNMEGAVCEQLTFFDLW